MKKNTTDKIDDAICKLSKRKYAILLLDFLGEEQLSEYFWDSVNNDLSEKEQEELLEDIKKL